MNTINLKFPKDFFKDYAKGRPCQIRIARLCGYIRCDPDETTVLCHVNMAGLKAMGKKLVPDLCAAWGCGTCHSLVDGRAFAKPAEAAQTNLTAPMIQLYHMEGVMRTLEQLVKNGVLPNP